MSEVCDTHALVALGFILGIFATIIGGYALAYAGAWLAAHRTES